MYLHELEGELYPLQFPIHALNFALYCLAWCDLVLWDSNMIIAEVANMQKPLQLQPRQVHYPPSTQRHAGAKQEIVGTT